MTVSISKHLYNNIKSPAYGKWFGRTEILGALRPEYRADRLSVNCIAKKNSWSKSWKRMIFIVLTHLLVILQVFSRKSRATHVTEVKLKTRAIHKAEVRRETGAIHKVEVRRETGAIHKAEVRRETRAIHKAEVMCKAGAMRKTGSIQMPVFHREAEDYPQAEVQEKKWGKQIYFPT